jgi:TPR repeat protein
MTKNHDEAIRLYQMAADKGNKDALYHLAQFYHYEKGVKLDYKKAFRLYTAATKEGCHFSKLALSIKINQYGRT